MALRCLRCRSVSADEDMYCSECGAPLSSAESVPSEDEGTGGIAVVAIDPAEEALATDAEAAQGDLSRVYTDAETFLRETSAQAAREIGVTWEESPVSSSKVKSSAVKSFGTGWGKDVLDLAIDVLRPCVVGNNTLRVYMTANRELVEDIVLTVKPHIGSCAEAEQACGCLSSEDEFGRDCERIFTLENLPEGAIGCDICLRFAYNGVLRQYVGQIEINVNRREDLLDVVRQNIHIHYNPQTTIGNVAQAGDVRVFHKSDGGIGRALEGIGNTENPMTLIDRMSRAGDRTYRRIPMRLMSGNGLSDPPPEAKAKEIEVLLGYGRIQFFVDDIVCIGHSVKDVRYSDIVIDAPEEADASAYDRISRIHCMLRYYGADVEVCDGRIDVNGQIVPSSNGTMLNLKRLPPCSSQPLCNGELRLGVDPKAIKLGVKLASPAGCDQCKIAESERLGCAGGKRPCVVISRSDDSNIKYVALWSCFDLGTINRNYKGIVIFHYNGAFGWRRGRKTGWLKSGENFGSSQIPRITVSKVWNR